MKKEYYILLAVILGLSAYLVLRDTDKIQYDLPEVPAMAKNAVTTMEIQQAGKTLLVSKEGGKWVLGEKKYTADANKVDAMLKAIEEFKLTAMVSEAKDYGRYNLSDDKKITVKVKDKDGKTLEIDLGKPAGAHRHSFVKLPGDSRVFHGSGNTREVFDVDAEALRDKRVLSFHPDEIREISLKYKGQTLKLVLKTVSGEDPSTEPAKEKPEPGKAVAEKDVSAKKEAKKWETSDGKAVNESEVQTLISELSQLRCESFLPDKTVKDFKSPLYTLELTGGTSYAITLFDKESIEAEVFQAVSSASEEPFVLPRWVAEKIMPDFSKIIQAAAEGKKQTEPDKD
jgi:hypothetical protein